MIFRHQSRLSAYQRAVRLIRHASSLGAVESTMERRAANAGQEHLPPALLRLSVGIESFDDIRSDLAQALQQAHLSAGA